MTIEDALTRIQQRREWACRETDAKYYTRGLLLTTLDDADALAAEVQRLRPTRYATGQDMEREAENVLLRSALCKAESQRDAARAEAARLRIEAGLFREIVEAISREDVKYQLPTFIQSAMLAALEER